MLVGKKRTKMTNFRLYIDHYPIELKHSIKQRWSRGHKARGQGQGHKKNPRPRPSTAFSEDRPYRGQGQECSRPRPRTKDTAVSVLKKKKVFKKVFQAISVARIFDWVGLNHKSHAITSSKIYLLALNQDFAKGDGLN